MRPSPLLKTSHPFTAPFFAGRGRPAALLVALTLALAVQLGAPAAWGILPAVEKATVNIVADRTAYEPGETARLAVLLDIEQGWHTNSAKPTFEYLIPTQVELELPPGWPEARMEYPEGSLQTFAFADQPLSVYDGQTSIYGSLAVPVDAQPGTTEQVIALVTYQACDDSSCLPPVTAEAPLILTVGSGGEAVAGVFSLDEAPGPGSETAKAGGPNLALILLFAVLGGLILNVMPCVLPVLSLKVFGLVRSAGEGRRAVTLGGLATAAGILVSFWALAAAAVIAKTAGSAVGWGVQFQNPVFVTFLLVILVLFCLNLWGLFEIQLPASLARVGSSGPQEGAAGHFVSGLFATLMATPCSAPFLGTALGFALGQTGPVIVATFTAVGLGMALPYLVLAAFPRAAGLFPKPGAWMDIVKGVMGFLLAAAAVWLLFVLSAQISAVRLALIELGLLVLALFVWLRHRGLPGGLGRKLAAAGTMAAVAAVIALPFFAEAGESGRGDTTAETLKLIPWTPWNPAEAERLAAAGTPVFVDVTADWCFTCKFNEKLVLETEEVAGAFERHGVVPMKADWTNRNPEIGDYLASFDRYGIPFYVLYRPGAEPYVFSEQLTKSAVIEALASAGSQRAGAGYRGGGGFSSGGGGGT